MDFKKIQFKSPCNINKRDILFIDGERTFPAGADNTRRWMELAIIDGTGDSVYHGYFNPGFDIENRFQKKGLTDEVLMFAPSFESQWLLIKQLLKGKHIIAWWMEMEKRHFPEELSFCKILHCAQARFSPLVGEYSMQHGNYKNIGMWNAFDMLGLPSPPGYRHRAVTDVQAMRLIWEWLDKTQIFNLLLNDQQNNNQILF